MVGGVFFFPTTIFNAISAVVTLRLRSPRSLPLHLFVYYRPPLGLFNLFVAPPPAVLVAKDEANVNHETPGDDAHEGPGVPWFLLRQVGPPPRQAHVSVDDGAKGSVPVLDVLCHRVYIVREVCRSVDGEDERPGVHRWAEFGSGQEDRGGLFLGER